MIGSERGSAPAAALAFSGVVVACVGAIGLLGQGYAAHARAEAAADLASIAAADALRANTVAPCIRARELIELNRAEFGSCDVRSDQTVTITASVTLPGMLAVLGPVHGHARAGPDPTLPHPTR